MGREGHTYSKVSTRSTKQRTRLRTRRQLQDRDRRQALGLPPAKPKRAPRRKVRPQHEEADHGT